MAFYLNQHVHFDGALMLYQRNLSVAVPNAKQHRQPVWYMRLKLSGHKGYYERSTKLKNYAEAYEFAKGELLRLQQNVRLGHTLDEYTFEEHWDDWFQRNKANATWTPMRQRWHENYAKRYFKPYFSDKDGKSKLLNDITLEIAAGYWDWRNTYWQRNAGEKLIKHNPKRRRSKSKSTKNAKREPSAKTLAMEQSALNQIFRDAAERGRLKQLLKLRSTKRLSKEDRRATFNTHSEYNSLANYLISYRDFKAGFKAKRATAQHRLQRSQLYYLVMILSNSGLRVGEARQINWQDIKFDVRVSGSDLRIAEIRVPDKTKRGFRYVQTQPNANDYLKEWKKLTPYNKKTHPVFFGQKQGTDGEPTRFVDLNKNFQAFLRKAKVEGRDDGLLRDRDGKVRSLYSLRHVYATMRIEKGNVDWEDLALNMGCQIAQIEKHYAHVTPRTRRREITKMAPKPHEIERQEKERQASLAEKNMQPTKDEIFKLEALRRYERKELSEAALLECLKLPKSE